MGCSQEGIAGGTYHDAATLEAFNWAIFDASDPLYPATLSGLDETLRLPSGGYKRNDDNGSHYDSNEWMFIDLRMANARRLRGDVARADELVAWVTANARANYDLIPELLNAFPDAGPLWSFTGATPMVGFGAASYVLALEQRAGMIEAYDCGTPPLTAPKRRHVRFDRRVAVIIIVALAAIAIVFVLRRHRYG
jgi:GH15 family glucan-1,4-alpha-glucosidase